MAQVNLGHVKGDKGDTGSQGPQGIQGIQGVQGPAGPGCPTGGTAGQVLMKDSGTDYDYNWSNINFATLRPVAFAVATNEWTLSNGVYTAEFTTAYITSTSYEELYVDNSFYTYGKTQIKATKKSGGGGLILTTETIPTGTITGTLKIIDTDDGKVPVIIEDTTVPIANGGTGQSTVAGVRSAFSIPDVVDNLTTNDGTKALSAKQGYTLNSNLLSIMRYVSTSINGDACDDGIIISSSSSNTNLAANDQRCVVATFTILSNPVRKVQIQLTMENLYMRAYTGSWTTWKVFSRTNI